MNKRLKVILISLGCILIGIAGFMTLKATKPAPPKKKAEYASPLVRVLVAKKEDIQAVVEETGNVTPKTLLEITAEVSGRIDKVSESLRNGYFVRKGELLIEIDPREYRYNVANFKAQIAQLNAELAKIDQEKINIRLNLKVEEEKLQLAEAELARKKSLLVSGSLSQSEVDKQDIEAKQMKASLLNQQNALALMKSQKDLTKAKIDATKAQMENAELKLEKTKILAPFDGRVIEESVEIGQYVQTGQKLASIFDIAAMEIVVYVSENKMPKFGTVDKSEMPAFTDVTKVNDFIRKYGPEATVRFRWADREKSWKGKVTRMEGRIDVATRTLPLVVEIKDPFKDVIPGKSPPLVPGMFVQVALKGMVYKNVVKIPRAALHAGTVYVVSDGKLEVRKVKVAGTGRDYVLVSKGLNNGDQVIVSPIPVPIPGSPVRIASSSDSKSQDARRAESDGDSGVEPEN
jgi:RND family efflux transporter MFP subunit